MHALLHRTLAPQTISHAWLVLTVASTFALAVAQSAIASASPAVAGLPSARVALTVPAPGPAPTPDTAPCRAAAPAEGSRAGAHRPATARRAACGTGAARSTPAFRPWPPRRSTADALATIYGGAGPHGPPVGDATMSFAGLFADSLTFDFSLSLAHSAASGLSAPAVEVSASLAPIAGAPA
jgi:hypothetical protein